MKLVFKVTASSPSSPPTVKDTNLPSHYAGVNVSMAWSEWGPAIRQATQKFIVPFLGALYEDLATKYEEGENLTPEQEIALEFLQDAVAGYAVWTIMPSKTAAVAGLGVVQNTPDGGSQSATQWAWREKRIDALAQGDDAMDNLLNYLDRQVSDDVTYFNLWKNDPAYKKKKSDFFRGAAALDDLVSIRGSFRTFNLLAPYLQQVEQRHVKPLLCDTLYAACLVTTPSVANAKLLPYIRQAVAYLGALEALPHHRVAIDADGFRFVSSTDGFEDRRNSTNSIHEQAVANLAAHYERRGREALDDLRAFLEANLDTYPDYRDSACRPQSSARSHRMYQSPDNNGMVGVL